MRTRELFEGLSLCRVPEGVDMEIERVVSSAKQASEKTLYVVSKTALSNGRYGLESAYARGCRAFLCANDAYPGEGAAVWIAEEPERLLGELAARVYGHPARRMTVLGITGSVGKTSVAAQTVRILRLAGHRACALTSDGIDIPGECSFPDAIVPDAAEIQRILARMAAWGCEIAVLELSSYQLAHFAAESIPFAAVLLTNLLPRHVGEGEHKSFEAYCEAKRALLRAKGAFCVLPCGVDAETTARVIRVGVGGDIWAQEARVERLAAQAPRTRFQCCTAGTKNEITIPVMGDMAVHVALCTVVLCRIVGLEMAQITGGLALPMASGRLECISACEGRLIFRDAAFLPQDVEAALDTLRPLATGRLCVLLGSVGGRARARRQALARVAEKGADHVYLTADDPDFEPVEQICHQMRDALQEVLRAEVIADRRACILRAVREMRPGDVLLILAKPYDKGQLVQGCYLPFDEREIVRQALEVI